MPDRPASQPFAADAARLLLAEGLAFPIGFLITAMLTRTLAPADYGVFCLTTTMVGLVEWGVLALFSRAIIARATEPGDWRQVGAASVRAAGGVALVGAVLLCLGRTAIAARMGEPRLPPYLAVLAWDIPLFTAGQACGSVLVAVGRIKQRAVCLVVRHGVRLCLTVALVAWLGTAQGALLATLAASAAELALGLGLTGLRPWRAVRFPYASLATYALPTAFATFALRAVERLDVLALKTYDHSSIMVGHYVAAQGLAMALPMAVFPAMGVLLAAARRAWQGGEPAEARRLAELASRQLPRLLPLAALGIGMAPEILGLAFGAAFADAADAFAWLLAAGVAQAVLAVGSTLLIALGRLRPLVIASAGMLIAALLGQWLVTERWHAVGAAAVTAGAIGATGLICLRSAAGTLGLKARYVGLVRCLGLAGGVLALARLVPAAGAAALLGKLCLLVAATMGAMWVTREIAADERAALKKLVSQRTFDRVA